MRIQKITIQLVDEQKNNEKYLIQLHTNGKETNDIAILPSNTFYLTDANKLAIIQVNINVPYLLKVYRTSAKSMEELYKNKSKTLITEEVVPEQPVAELQFTPTAHTKKIEIKIKN